MKRIFFFWLLVVLFAFISYQKLFFLSSNNIGDSSRYLFFFENQSNIFSFEPIFVFFHYLVNLFNVNPLVLFSLIAALNLGILCSRPRIFFDNRSSAIGSLICLLTFCALSPSASAFSSFVSVWRFLYGFLFLLFAISLLHDTNSFSSEKYSINVRLIFGYVFLLLGSFSHLTVFVFSLCFISAKLAGPFATSFVNSFYVSRTSLAFSVSLKSILSTFFFLAVIMSILVPIFPSYIYPRLSHYQDSLSFSGSNIQAYLSVLITYAVCFFIVRLSSSQHRGVLCGSYLFLPFFLILFLFVSPSASYRLASQFYFLGLLCFVFSFESSLKRSWLGFGFH